MVWGVMEPSRLVLSGQKLDAALDRAQQQAPISKTFLLAVFRRGAVIGAEQARKYITEAAFGLTYDP